MAGWLILAVLLRDRADRDALADRDDSASVVIGFVLLPFLLVLGMPWIVWACARDGGGSRLDAVGAVAGAFILVWCAWFWLGVWGALAAALLIGTGTAVWVGVRARRDLLEEERAAAGS